MEPFFYIKDDNVEELPKDSAIYEIWSLRKGTEKPLYRKYLGCSKNLKKNISEYFNGSGESQELIYFLQNYRVKIRYHIIEINDDSAQIEALLYEKNKNDKSYIFNSDSKFPTRVVHSKYTSIVEEDS